MKAHLASPRLALALCALMALGANAAWADSQSGRALVGASAPGVCRISGPQTLSADNALYTSTSDRTGLIAINQFVDPATGAARSARIALSFPAICNHSHTLVFRSAQGGLARVAGPAGGNFSSNVPYSIATRWGGQARGIMLAGVANSQSIVVLDGAKGSIELDIRFPGGGAPLVGGQYADQLVVELAADS
jgi:hypothetical protein